MDILIHTGFAFPRGNACANRMRVFYQVFKAAGNNVKVLAPEDSGISDGIDPQDVLICDTYKMAKKTTISRLKNGLSFAKSSMRRAKEVGNVDVVLTTSPPPLISVAGWMIAKAKKAKLVYDVRDIWPDVALEIGSFSARSIYAWVFRTIANFMYKKSDLVLTVSPGKVKKLRSYIKDKKKVLLVENGLDEDFLKHTVDDSVVEKYHLDNCFSVVYTGNIGLAQGLGHLLDLADKVKDKKVQFLIFGEGAEKELLEREVKNKHLDNVHFEGNVIESEIFNVLRHASLSYIPLVNGNLRDSIPTKTYEALGVGCPVLMVANGDALDLVKENHYGWSISPEETDKLPALFDKILSEYDEVISRKDVVTKTTVENHSRQKIAITLEKTLRKFACN